MQRRFQQPFVCAGQDITLQVAAYLWLNSMRVLVLPGSDSETIPLHLESLTCSGSGLTSLCIARSSSLLVTSQRLPRSLPKWPRWAPSTTPCSRRSSRCIGRAVFKWHSVSGTLRSSPNATGWMLSGQRCPGGLWSTGGSTSTASNCSVPGAEDRRPPLSAVLLPMLVIEISWVHSTDCRRCGPSIPLWVWNERSTTDQ